MTIVDYDPKVHKGLSLLEVVSDEVMGNLATLYVPTDVPEDIAEMQPWYYVVDIQTEEKGGPGSGHFGHAGRSGKVGGSAPGKGATRDTKVIGMINDVESKIPSHLLQGYDVIQSDEHSDAYLVDSNKLVLNDGQILGYATRDQALRHIAHEMGHPPYRFIMSGVIPGKDILPDEYWGNPELFAEHFSKYFTGRGSTSPTRQQRKFFDSLSTIEEKQLPIDDAARRKLFQVRLDLFYDASDALAEQVFTGQLSISDWELSMRTLVKEMHTSAAAIGKGGWDQMSFQEWGRLGTPVREQYKWLHKFAQDIADRVDDISLGTIRARARMYGRAAGYVAELMQAPKEIIEQLPWLPKDGSTECLTNCKCAWMLKVIKKTKVSQTVRAVWRMLEAEHCRDCPERNGHIEVFDVDVDIQVPSIIGGF